MAGAFRGNMKKITVVGRGTAGALGALHFNKYIDKSKFEVEWMFDDSIPAQSVGEGSTLLLPKSLYETSGFTHSQLAELGGTVKTGIKKTGWGSGAELFHDFTYSGVAYHFQASMLHQYSLNYLKDKVSINNSFASNIENIDSDFVFDCSGVPKNLGKEFVKSECIPVNTARVWQCPWDVPRFTHTLTLARPYGWVFGIPLSNRLSIGYIYNKDFATPEMIEDDIKEVFKEYNVEPGKDGNYIEFNSYYRKDNFHGNIGHSGNSSFFLEPLEATSTAMMESCQRNMFDQVVGGLKAQQSNDNYLDLIDETETLIMLHYYAGSQWDNDFWKYAKDKANIKIGSIKKDSRVGKALNEGLSYIGNQEFTPPVIQHGQMWSTYSYALHLDKLNIADNIEGILTHTTQLVMR